MNASTLSLLLRLPLMLLQLRLVPSEESERKIFGTWYSNPNDHISYFIREYILLYCELSVIHHLHDEDMHYN